jgi:hypothetical protein
MVANALYRKTNNCHFDIAFVRATLAGLAERTRGKPAPKRQLLREDQAAFCRCRINPSRLDALFPHRLRFDRNDYSVPVKYALRKLIVVATVEVVRLVYEGRLVARHRRCSERERTFFEPIRYSAVGSIHDSRSTS